MGSVQFERDICLIVRMSTSILRVYPLLLRNLNIFGLWPNTSNKLHLRLYWIYSYCLHTIISATYAVLTTINLLFLDDLQKMIVAMYPTLTIVAYFSKLLNYYYYKDGFIRCLPMLYAIQKGNTADENRFAKSHLKHITTLTLFFFIIGQFTIFAASLKPLLSDIPELPLPSWYPIDWKRNQMNFWIVYVHEVVGALIMVNVSVGIDGYVWVFGDVHWYILTEI